MAGFEEGQNRQRGYVGSNLDPTWSGQTVSPTRWGGTAGYAVDGYLQPGTSGADVDVERLRGLGQAAQGATGPVIDQAQANESRGLMVGSLAGLQNVAEGRDSQALRMAQSQARTAGMAQRSMAASVRGGAMARAAAARGAQRNIARQNAQIRQMGLAGQAQEMANARGQLMQGTSGLRAQDLGLATSQADLEARQRALNEQQQQAYERMAWDTRNADMGAGIEQQRIDTEKHIADRQHKLALDRKRQEEQQQATSFAASMFAGGFRSDERAKTNIVPVGSLAHLMR